MSNLIPRGLPFLALIGLLLPACGWSGVPTESTGQPEIPSTFHRPQALEARPSSSSRVAPSPAPLAKWPAVIADYKIQRSDGQTQDFRLVRSARRIEHHFGAWGAAPEVRGTHGARTHHPSKTVIEIWSLSPSDELSRQLVFPEDGRVIDFTAGDLKAINLLPPWQELSTLVPTETSAIAPPEGAPETPAPQRRIAVEWSEEWALPLLVTSEDARGKTVLRRTAVEHCPTAECPQTSLDRLSQLDFSDLGDKENDPWVAAFLSESGHGHGH